MPFYKRQGEELQSTTGNISGPGFELSEATKDEHTYPVQGWYWFDTLDQAMVSMKAETNIVTKRQAMQALILAGKDEMVAAALAAIPGIEGKLARAEWDQSSTVERNRPLVIQMGQALGMTSDDLDALFTLAATL